MILSVYLCLIRLDRNSLVTALLSMMRKWVKSSSSKETNVPRSLPSSSKMAWRNLLSRCTGFNLPYLHIPYVQVICSKREIGGIYNNISFVVVFFEYGYVRRLSNMFSYLPYVFPIQIPVYFTFHESHMHFSF